MFVFLLLSISASTLAQTPSLLASVSYCGFQHPDDYNHPDNVGAALPDEFPWVASLIYKYPDGAKATLCSGALITARYVVTAAQCIANPLETALVGVRLGEYSRKNKTDCFTVEGIPDCFDVLDMGIEEKVVHPRYNGKTRENDIALIKLDRAVRDFTDYIRPICVYKGPSLSKPGDRVYISGFGRTNVEEEPADLKKKIAASVVANDKCQDEYPDSQIKDTQVCTQDLSVNSVFTCKGDAGAPVMFVLGKPPQWYLEGVVSWGSGCGATLVQIHTRISLYADWIEENLNS